jgi:glycosyltransferase involved in cell wall biosynthesis
MRIAQVAPLYERVPPKRYGATERVVHYLSEALVQRGHEVTLFASGDSNTSGTLVPCCRHALWHDTEVADTLVHHVAQLERVAARASAFDIVHFHTEPLHLPLARRLKTACLTTLHGEIRSHDLGVLLNVAGDSALVSVSWAQREPAPDANWVATIPPGLPLDAFEPSAKHEGYLLWMGRMVPAKGPDTAIEIALRAGKPLKMAAAVHAGERDWFESHMRALLTRHAHCVEYLGEVGGAQRAKLLRRAQALLMPVAWEEPFGMVMIEALACATPVVAYRRGAIPEVLVDGVSGYVVDGIEEAVDAVERLPALERAQCRAEFERRFTAARMTDDYLRVYRMLCEQNGARRPVRAHASSRGAS